MTVHVVNDVTEALMGPALPYSPLMMGAEHMGRSAAELKAFASCGPSVMPDRVAWPVIGKSSSKVKTGRPLMKSPKFILPGLVVGMFKVVKRFRTGSCLVLSSEGVP